ncbi:peptide/nickel transport system substrate-binding protein [Clostridium amylolyticum]|uniref:Peptide/nickel transport system substrate-binding protein n=1 Tax=Clostridium amylolyticum TaxID=1121298 RepID=A0A1M6NFC2_9CLOT|nr:ABC transporter substrate-binding protein [Clostridium amylolyticum]SHJ94334.1 peptide/nickel transport system substrate-binding protein [Clostridium amylolyticum]
MKSKKIIASILAVSLIFAAGCGSKSSKEGKAQGGKKEGGTFIMAVGSDPAVLNPLYGNDRTTMTINNTLFSPLFIVEGSEIKYYLAESFKASEDFLTYTLKLKKDLKWHDGKAITADDLMFTLDKIMDEKQNSFLRDYLVIGDKLVQYKKVDDLTLEFKLPTVTMAFVSAISQISPLPKHIFEGEADIAKSSKNETPIGSGPFKFKEAKKGESVTLVKNDDYFGGKPHLDSVVYRVLPDPNSSNVALQNGEISVKYIEPKDAEKFKKDSKLSVYTYIEGMLNNMVYNQNNEVLKKLEVRQAIAYAINKDELVKAAYISDENAEKAYSVFTPDTLYQTKDVNKFDQDINKAKELLNKAGVSNVKLKLAYINSKKDMEAQALIVQQSLKEIGITIDLMPMERSAFYQKLTKPKENKDFDLAFNGYVMGSEPDSYRPLFLSGNPNNYGSFSDTKIDELWNKGIVETDKTKRAEIYTNIQKQLAEGLPLYPIAYPKSIIAVDKRIGGVKEAETVPIFMFRDLSKLYFTE